MGAVSNQFRAGAAKADITPANGIQLAGSIGRLRPCTGVNEPLFARALVLEQGSRRFCILALDVLVVDKPWAEEIRRCVHKVYGIPREAVMVHATQTHSGAEIGNDMCGEECKHIPDEYPWMRGGDPRYNEPAVAGIMDAIGKAIEKLSPVLVAFGRAIDGRVAFNRRHVLRTGESLCQPPKCDPRVLQVEGPADPEVGVVTFTAADGNVVAALLHFTSHPCNGYWFNQASPDWPGTWCNEMEAHFGAQCTGLTINGCCGNIITFNYLNPDQTPDQSDYHLIGRQLAQSTKRALETMTPLDTSSAAFGWTSEVLTIPLRRIPDEMIAESKKMLTEHPKPIWTDEKNVDRHWMHAVGVYNVAKEQETTPLYPFEVQALRIGNYGLVAVGGEPFAETQLQVKLTSPLPFTQMAHMCHGYIGYIPTKRAIRGGGYETMTGFGSRLAPEAAELIEESSVKLLKDLKNSANKLPNVFIIGDSISIGYTPVVAKLLEGKANVTRNPDNAMYSANGLKNIPSWLGDKKFDVIHFNFGIWDLHHLKPDADPLLPSVYALRHVGVRRTTDAQYEENLRGIVKILKSTGAKLIWATLTPLPESETNAVYAGDEFGYNKISTRVMTETGITVNDLHTHVFPNVINLQPPGDCHFTDEGNQVLGRKVAGEIAAALGIKL